MANKHPAEKQVSIYYLMMDIFRSITIAIGWRVDREFQPLAMGYLRLPMSRVQSLSEEFAQEILRFYGIAAEQYDLVLCERQPHQDFAFTLGRDLLALAMEVDAQLGRRSLTPSVYGREELLRQRLLHLLHALQRFLTSGELDEVIRQYKYQILPLLLADLTEGRLGQEARLALVTAISRGQKSCLTDGVFEEMSRNPIIFKIVASLAISRHLNGEEVQRLVNYLLGQQAAIGLIVDEQVLYAKALGALGERGVILGVAPPIN